MALDEFLIPPQPQSTGFTPRSETSTVDLDDLLIEPPIPTDPVSETVAGPDEALVSPAPVSASTVELNTQPSPAVVAEAAVLFDLPLVSPPTMDEPGRANTTSLIDSPLADITTSFYQSAQPTPLDVAGFEDFFASAPSVEQAGLSNAIDSIDDEAILTPSDLIVPRLDPIAEPSGNATFRSHHRSGDSGDVGPADYFAATFGRPSSDELRLGPETSERRFADAGIDDAIERIESRLDRISEMLGQAVERIRSTPPATPRLDARPRSFRARADS